MNKNMSLALGATSLFLACACPDEAFASTSTIRAYPSTGQVDCIFSMTVEETRDGEETDVRSYLGYRTTYNIVYDGKNYLVTEEGVDEGVNGVGYSYKFGPYKGTLTTKKNISTLTYAEPWPPHSTEPFKVDEFKITFPTKGGEANVEKFDEKRGGWRDYFNYTFDDEFWPDVNYCQDCEDGYYFDKHTTIHEEGSGYCEFVPN